MLWNYFKHLKNKAPIYLEVMDVQARKIPQAYVVLEEDVFDGNLVAGDGKSLVRNSSYNIRIHARTVAKAKTIVQAYRQVLLEKGMPFEQYGPTFDPGTDYYSILITGRNTYGT